MVNNFRFLFCTLACFFSITTYASDLPANPRNDTPAQSLKRLQNNFKSQANYDAGMKRNLAELDARIYMNEGTKRTSVEQMLTRSGVLESGAKAEVVAKVTQPADTGKAAKTLADRLGKAKDYAKKAGKASIPSFLGGAAVQALVDGVGWVMDEGGKVTRTPDTPVNADSSFIKCWTGSGGQGCYSTPESAAQYTICGGTANIYYNSGTMAYANCENGGKATVFYIDNPNYDPSAPPRPNTVVSEEEKEQVLKNLLNDPKYSDLASQMIGNTYSMGPENPEPDPTVVNDLKNAQKDVLKSDNPKGDGKTRTDPKIDTGTQGQADTTPKPDTGTGTNPNTGTGTTPSPNPNPNNGSTTNFELPAFCNYAAKLCDWLDWTQEDKELEEPEKEEPEEFDIGTIDKNRFRANGQCPAPIEVNESVTALGKSVDFDLTIEWTQICNVAEDTSPLVLLISTITGLLILVGGGRSGES